MSTSAKRVAYHLASKHGKTVARKRLGWEIYRGFTLDAWKEKPSRHSRTSEVTVHIHKGSGSGSMVHSVEANTLSGAMVKAKNVINAMMGD